MLTRREALRLGGVALIAGTPFGRTSAIASTVRTPVDFTVPAGACDCHVHVVGDVLRFPMAAGRPYTPPPASVDALLDLQHALHLDRVVIVQPSFYGTDNTAVVDAMRQLGARRARGVAVIDGDASAESLDGMRQAGIRGIRGWHIQLYTRLSVIAALAGDFAAAPVPLVFDHFGGAPAALGAGQVGFDALLGLVRSGKAYVKISGAYRASKSGPDYADVAPLAKALIAANPDRIVWGSDWPHTDSTRLPGRASTDVTPFIPVDDGMLLNQLEHWAPDEALRHKILVDNPKRLYDF
jgi:predicted TIM-barrel fold metal-dependent hydrolase